MNTMICIQKSMAQLLLRVVRSNFHKKNIILLSEIFIVIYKADKSTGVENDRTGNHLKLSTSN